MSEHIVDLYSRYKDTDKSHLIIFSCQKIDDLEYLLEKNPDLDLNVKNEREETFLDVLMTCIDINECNMIRILNEPEGMFDGLLYENSEMIVSETIMANFLIKRDAKSSYKSNNRIINALYNSKKELLNEN